MKNGHNIRIVIADGHAMFRDGLRKLLEAQPGFEVVGEADNGVEASRVARLLKPHVLLLEITIPRRSGLETLRDLHSSPTLTRPLLLAATIDKDQLIEALCVGACGLVMKTSTTDLLFKGIRAVMAGQYWLGRENISDLVRALCDRRRRVGGEGPRNDFGLTPRELEIVSAIVAGYTNKDIAQKFCLSEITIKHHLGRVFHKLHVSNRLELAVFAVDHHLACKDGAASGLACQTATEA